MAAVIHFYNECTSVNLIQIHYIVGGFVLTSGQGWRINSCELTE